MCAIYSKYNLCILFQTSISVLKRINEWIFCSIWKEEAEGKSTRSTSCQAQLKRIVKEVRLTSVSTEAWRRNHATLHWKWKKIVQWELHVCVCVYLCLHKKLKVNHLYIISSIWRLHMFAKKHWWLQKITHLYDFRVLLCAVTTSQSPSPFIVLNLLWWGSEEGVQME